MLISFQQWVENLTLKTGPVNQASANKPLKVDPATVAATAKPGQKPSDLFKRAEDANRIGAQTGKGALDAAKAIAFKHQLDNPAKPV